MGLLLTGYSFMAAGQGNVALRVSVSASTCDVAMLSESSLSFLPFSPDEFARHALPVKNGPPLVLSFADAGCKKMPVSFNRRISLLISGPAAQGGRGQVWGDRYDDLAWGVRLRYFQLGKKSFRVLTPLNNRVVFRQAPTEHHLSRKGEDEVVIQPEIYAWNTQKVKSGQSLLVPLVFSVLYE